MGFCLKQFCLASSLSLFSCGLLAAERQAIGDWQLQSTLNSIEASTSNGGTSFGLYCQADQCMFYLHDTLMCQPGARSPILMSGVGNAASLSIQCTQIGGVLFQILEPFNTVFDELKKGGLVSFAVPLQNGSFGVSRFSLNGATEAVRRALLKRLEGRYKRLVKVSKPNRRYWWYRQLFALSHPNWAFRHPLHQ